jgi:hypothetical protein
MRQKRQDSIGINQNYYRLSIIIFLNLRLYVDKLKLTDFCQICDFPFLVSKISKLDSKVKKINNLYFCQYCIYICVNSGNLSRHYRIHKCLEYKKEIKLHIDEVF